MSELVLMAKDFVTLLFWIFLGAILLYFISHLIMAVLKTLFFDVQIKLYRVWSKRLKKYTNDEELEKVLDEITSRKKI